MKEKNYFLDVIEKQNKKVFFVILLAAFGILLFIAIALTVPWER